MQSLLTVVGAVVAVVAGLVGVIATIEQLTLRARLRRTAELAKTLSSSENHPERKAVLTSIHDVAVARLVSGWLLPWWWFAEFAVWIVIGPGATATSVGRFGWGAGSAASIVACIVVTAIAGRRFVRLYLERQRVARESLGRQKVAPPRTELVHQMEDGTRTEFVMGLLISAGLTLTGTGVGILAHEKSFAPWWAGVLVLAGVLLAAVPVPWLRTRTVRPLISRY
jgi:hypothetical protein